MNARKWAQRLGAVCALILLGIFAAGCKTSNPDLPPGTEFSDVAGGPTAGAGTAQSAGSTPPGTLPPANGSQALRIGSDAPEYRVKVGDLLKVTFADLPTPWMPFEGRIREDGKVTLNLNETFDVVGKTRGQLATEIRERYVPRKFLYMTVLVDVSEGSRYYYVGGEVKTPGAKPYVARIKLLEAIQASGDFTDYAKRSGVTVTRGGKKYKINCKDAKGKHPELNIEILPDDRIEVPRSAL
jgi:polysaccharide export outer membrane protein